MTGNVLALRSVLRHAHARVAVAVSSEEGRPGVVDPDAVVVVVRADHPQSIDEVYGVVASVVGLVTKGLPVTITCPDRLEEAELVAACTAVALGVPAHEVVEELTCFDWIDFTSYLQLVNDFRDHWHERRFAA